MSTEHLNEFFNHNEFNRKLREKIDGYEPSVSDSLWDRIEHGLDARHVRERKLIRLAWLMAALLLVSGGATLYLWRENQQLHVKAKQLDKQSAGLDILHYPSANDLTAMGKEAKVLDVPPPMKEPLEVPVLTDEHVGSNLTFNSRGTKRPYTATNVERRPESKEDVLAINNFAEKQTYRIEHKGNLIGSALYSNLPIQVMPQYLASKKTRQLFELHTSIYYHQSGLGRQPGAHSFESGGLGRQVGLLYGSHLGKNWWLKSGIQFHETVQEVNYKIVRVQVLSSIPTTNSYDSIVKGDSLHHQNRQQWLEVPIQLHYLHSFNSRWSYGLGGGIGVAIPLSASGKEANPAVHAFDPIGTSKERPFRTHLNLMANAGVWYRVNSSWRFGAQVGIRQSLTNLHAVVSTQYPQRRPLGFGGGISMIFTP